jgi:hypothetical protein
VIFHTKYPKNFRASPLSAQFFLCAPPLTWNPGSAPDICLAVWQESLKSDGHQFHQYQENVQSPLILTELTEAQKHHDI